MRLLRLQGARPPALHVLGTGQLRRFHDRVPRWFKLTGPWPQIRPALPRWSSGRRSLFSRAARRKQAQAQRHHSVLVSVLVAGGLTLWSLYPADEIQHLKEAAKTARTGDVSKDDGSQGAWGVISNSFEGLSKIADSEWGTLKVVDLILPEWYKFVPGYLRKLQRELSMAPGSLADEIWHEASDPEIHPEIRFAAKVRVSSDICDEEKTFLGRRRAFAAAGLANYLGLDPQDVHPDDVPVIGMCGSGGGLRALVAGAGYLSAATDDGLFDCVTYTAGVSGSCWLQALYFSTVSQCNISTLIDHLKARLQVHIAFPPAAFNSLIAAPTNKPLLSGVVEKLRGDPQAAFGLVDVYGLLLAARLLVPKGDLGVDGRDFKLSNQRDCIRFGQQPMPIYTAVRHEIPEMDTMSPAEVPSVSEAEKERAKAEAWFQWVEITPCELFIEELGAGIPTWAMGRKFHNGSDIPLENGLHAPEIRTSLLLGMFGSAFCATLSHYYREIQPLVRRLSGFSAVDELIAGRNEDLSKVHPIDPASLPNPVYGMDAALLPKTAPRGVLKSDYIQLMDAGMSNNIPIYPLLRPGRDVEVIIAFDASSDVKTDNWLSVADGYARQRGIKGWPVGIGWPRASTSPEQTAEELEAAQAESVAEANQKLEEAKVDQAIERLGAGEGSKSQGSGQKTKSQEKRDADTAKHELGYCTVWVGTTEERSTEPPPPLKYGGGDEEEEESVRWRMMEPDAGLTVVYLPYLSNDKVPGVDPATSDYMSTWNFVYTPDQVDEAVKLARTNYAEGQRQIKATVRAVYERKKKLREQREERGRREHFRRMIRLGVVDKLGEGDHFS